MNTFHSKYLLLIILLASFSVLSHWNFWSYDFYAFGFNTTLAWSAFIGLMIWQKTLISLRENTLWLIPTLLIIISFSLYENPWLKAISIFTLPIIIGIFVSIAKCKNENAYLWNYTFLFTVVRQACKPLAFIIPSSKLIQQQIQLQSQSVLQSQNKQILKQVVLGLIILLPLAILAMILLSSADANFAKLIEAALQALFQHVDLRVVWKLFWIALLSVLLLAFFIAWSEPWHFSSTEKKPTIDSIIAIIVLSGLLLIYSVFLLLQIEYLFIDSLPIEFNQAEHLVKSGFWQLFFLSSLNVILFTVFYKNTSTLAQYFVTAFIAASGFLLLSAAWRMGLYIFYYGLSYEKFFASYTCLFAIGIFACLIYFSYIKEKQNLLKLLLFSALWCYGIASILPIEKIIFHSNVALAKHAKTRINLDHLSALSIDIYADITTLKNNDDNKQTAINGFDNSPATTNYQWSQWQRIRQLQSCQSTWYEKNISTILNCE